VDAGVKGGVRRRADFEGGEATLIDTRLGLVLLWWPWTVAGLLLLAAGSQRSGRAAGE